MEYLLVIFAFTLSPTGDVEDFTVMTQEFDTLEACNVAGRNLRELTGTDGPEYEQIKTLSYCVRPEDFGSYS